jgi:hypothetical protein
MQKKAIRLISNSKYNAHINPLFAENGVLPFDKLITLNRLLFMHSIAYNYAPQTFSNTWLTNAERNIQVRIDLFRIYIYTYISHWNVHLVPTNPWVVSRFPPPLCFCFDSLFLHSCVLLPRLPCPPLPPPVRLLYPFPPPHWVGPCPPAASHALPLSDHYGPW